MMSIVSSKVFGLVCLVLCAAQVAQAQPEYGKTMQACDVENAKKNDVPLDLVFVIMNGNPRLGLSKNDVMKFSQATNRSSRDLADICLNNQIAIENMALAQAKAKGDVELTFRYYYSPGFPYSENIKGLVTQRTKSLRLLRDQ